MQLTLVLLSQLHSSKPCARARPMLPLVVSKLPQVVRKLPLVRRKLPLVVRELPMVSAGLVLLPHPLAHLRRWAAPTPGRVPPGRSLPWLPCFN